MNVYLIQEDGYVRCWQADTASDAIDLAQAAYLEELELEEAEEIDEEASNWQRNIFQSCNLVGELANPDDRKP